MQVKNHILFLFLIFIFIAPSFVIAQENNISQDTLTQEIAEITPEQQAIINKFEQEFTQEIDIQIVSAITQTKKIDIILEELAQIIQNGLAKVSDKTQLILQIKSIRQFIAKIISNPFEHADTQTVNAILDINKKLIDKIEYAIKNGLQYLPEITPEFMQNKSQACEFIPIIELENKLQQNAANYKKLEAAMQTVGLSWINVAYRNFVFEPIKFAQKYNLPTIAKWTIFASIAAAYALYRFTPVFDKIFGKTTNMPTNLINQETLIKKTNNFSWRDLLFKNQEAIGQLASNNTIQENALLNTIKSASELSWLEKLEEKIYITKKMPITKLLLAAAPFLLYQDLIDLKDWAANKFESLHYKLMGGIQEKNYKERFGAINCNIATPRYTFKDVVGLEYIKKELKPLIEYLKNAARFERVGIGPEKGYVFVGKPGTGKSFMAEALAGEIAQSLSTAENNQAANFKFIPFEASQIFEIISQNGVILGIDAIMAFARQNAPCVIFIDEAHLLGLQCTADKELLSKLLNSLNGFLSNNISENVIMLLATNKPDNLDPALLRRGRLGKIIHFEYPTYEARKDYIEKKLSPLVADLQDFNIDKLARETENCTFEAIQSIIRKAFQETKINGNCLNQQALENALNQEIRQILPENKNLASKEIQMVAANFAANALTNTLLDTPDKLSCVTINPVMGNIKEKAIWDGYYENQEEIIHQGKIFTCNDYDTSNICSKQELIDLCKILVSGSIGQEILLGKSGLNFNKNSSEKIIKTALLVVSDGLTSGLDLINNKNNAQNNTINNITGDYYKNALELIENCKQQVRQLLENNKSSLEKIYLALLEHKTLDASQVHAIINNTN